MTSSAPEPEAVNETESVNSARITDSLVVELNGQPTVKGPDPAWWPVSVRTNEQ